MKNKRLGRELQALGRGLNVIRNHLTNPFTFYALRFTSCTSLTFPLQRATTTVFQRAGKIDNRPNTQVR
jgi:hypothetical protein